MSLEFQSIILITTIKTIEKYLYQVIGTILIVAGTIGGLINLAVFTQKNHRKNPCSIYFTAYNIFNLCYIYVSFLSLTLYIAYDINPSASNIVICCLRIYLSFVLNLLNPFFLILASIDRIMITSINVRTRQRSTYRFAWISVIIGTIFWSIFHSHAFICSVIIELRPNLFFCLHQSGVCLTLITYYSIIKEVSALVLLIICGIWTVNNVRKAFHVRVGPNIYPNNLRRFNTAKDRQLIRMILMDIIIYTIFSFMIAVFAIYQQITQARIKGFVQATIEGFIMNLCFLSVTIPFCSSCYTNLIASVAFRKEVKKVLLKIGFYFRNQFLNIVTSLFCQS